MMNDNYDQVPETDIAATTFAADGAKVGIGLHDKVGEDADCEYNGRDCHDYGGADDHLGVGVVAGGSMQFKPSLSNMRPI